MKLQAWNHIPTRNPTNDMAAKRHKKRKNQISGNPKMTTAI
jgi:hypothetical protein